MSETNVSGGEPDGPRIGSIGTGSPAEIPAAAEQLFGPQLPVVAALAELLAGDAVVRGLIGPREAPRLWDRHLLNCGALGELLPVGAELVDVGTGAGLPGLVLACARPDLSIRLVEPLARRTAFLTEAVDSLELGSRVEVVRGRIDDPPVRKQLGKVRWMTARAVAPLDRLARWCGPVLAADGRMLAMKGSKAAEEMDAARSVLKSVGLNARIVTCGSDVVDPPTTVVVLDRS